jgi:uncharacterized protein (DUF1330 family)
MQVNHRPTLLSVLVLLTVFGLGYTVAEFQNTSAHATSALPSEKAAYLVVSSTVVESDQMAAYGAAAGPGAQAAGVQVLARAESDDSLQLLEGNWPYTGSVTLERFTSMDALLKFWHSPEYQAAKKLREGALDVDFIIALEALDGMSSDE